MKIKSLHWTRRTVVFALIRSVAVLLALAVIWRSNDGGPLSAHYNVTTTDGRIAYLQSAWLGGGPCDRNHAGES